jgi:Ca2+:H+ antiporter
MSWLLIFVPVAVALEHLAPDRHLLIFVATGLAILPLAGWMGRATEQLAERAGEGVGGLLNATFGNAAELIIALAALRAGLHDVVKASLAGSIVGNILLVLGAAMLAGGLRRREQHFNAAGARPGDDLAGSIALGCPRPIAAPPARATAGRRSAWDLVVLLAVYGRTSFPLVTHAALFAVPRRQGQGAAWVAAPPAVATTAAIAG